MKKRYEEGGEVEFETKMGRNENIDDDVRARAMAAMAARESGVEIEPAKPAKPKAKPKAKAEPKAEPKKTSSFSKVQSPFAGKTSSFKKMASGGSVSSASKRADGCAIKGKTRGKMV
jgi:biotin carboxyl carrier protein